MLRVQSLEQLFRRFADEIAAKHPGVSGGSDLCPHRPPVELAEPKMFQKESSRKDWRRSLLTLLLMFVRLLPITSCWDRQTDENGYKYQDIYWGKSNLWHFQVAPLGGSGPLAPDRPTDLSQLSERHLALWNALKVLRKVGETIRHHMRPEIVTRKVIDKHWFCDYGFICWFVALVWSQDMSNELFSDGGWGAGFVPRPPEPEKDPRPGFRGKASGWFGRKRS